MKDRYGMFEMPCDSRLSMLGAVPRGSLWPVGAAAILFIGAMLKAHAIAVNPALGILYGSFWLQVGLVQLELVLAAWLLSLFLAKACRRAALATFGAFGMYSLLLALLGRESCGCFGQIQVDPWLTAALDSAIVLFLWHWRPVVVTHTEATAPRANGLGIYFAIFSLLAAVIVPATLLIAPAIFGVGTSDVASGDSFVMLEPARWVGKEFPIVSEIDVGEQVVDGTWLLVLYHNDCRKCQEVLPAYERLSQSMDDLRIALIEVPPYGNATRQYPSCTLGRLADNKSWFIETPSEITLKDGIVVAARSSPQKPQFSVPAVVP